MVNSTRDLSLHSSSIGRSNKTVVHCSEHGNQHVHSSPVLVTFTIKNDIFGITSRFHCIVIIYIFYWLFSFIGSILQAPTRYRKLMRSKSLPICNQLQNGIIFEPSISVQLMATSARVIFNC